MPVKIFLEEIRFESVVDFESELDLKQIALHTVGRLYSLHWGPEKNTKTENRDFFLLPNCVLDLLPSD